MAKWVLNYETGNYEYIDRNGFSYDQGKYVYNWDDSEYRREEENDRRWRSGRYDGAKTNIFDDDDEF